MLYFENDYCEGAHPAILQKLTETNFEKVSGYGTDPYCASAKEKIRAACACPEADVFSSRAAPRPTPSSSPPRSAAGRASSPPPPAMWPVMRRVPSSSPATRSSACPRRTASWMPPRWRISAISSIPFPSPA